MKETRQLISDVLQGKACVLSFDNVAFGPDKDITASILSALNFARLAFAAEGITPVLSRLLELLCSRKMVESAFAVCRDWPTGVELGVEDVSRAPMFQMSLGLVFKDYELPSPDHITTSLEYLRSLRSSAAILISRYPDVVACLRLRASTQEVFVIFNPRVTSDQEQVASLTFSTSLTQIARQLRGAFPFGEIHCGQPKRDWQAEMFEKCTGHVFVARTARDAGEESLILSSMTLLTLRAELEEHTRHNGRLKTEKQRLEKSAADLAAQLEEERTKIRRTESSKPQTTRDPSVRAQGHQLAKPSTGKREDFCDRDDEMDPNMQLALQLQAAFDSENDFLLKQRHELMQTAQRQYHCGVCLDDFPEDDVVRIDACWHEICRDCTRGHVCAKIEEHRFPVLCPVCMADHTKQNPGTISGALVPLLGVSEEQWATWVEMEIAQFSIPINCRKCHHSGFVDRQDLDAQSEVQCPFPACDHVWCKTCQQTVDPNGPKHSCDGTSELDHLMKQQGWRYCPNCKTPIQKTQGCNHLSCIAAGCNTHFCYRCGETINRTAIPREIQEGKTEHFRSCSLF